MTLELIKEYSATGLVSYQIRLEGKHVAKTLCFDLEVAMQHYNAVRDTLTKERTEVLLKETL